MLEINGVRAYVFDEKRWTDKLSKDYQVPLSDPARVTEVEHAVVLPLRMNEESRKRFRNGLFEGGLVTYEEDRCNFIAGHYRSYPQPESNRSCTQGYMVNPDEIAIRHETVIYGGLMTSHWGHTMCDTTSRLWYEGTTDERYKYVFVLTPGQEFPYQELLDLAGLTADRIEIIREPTQFDRVIVPDQAFFSYSGHFRPEWHLFFKRIRDKVELGTHEKIYFTRTALAKDETVNEIYFEDYYRARGYEIISPEKYSMREQVSFIAGAKSIVTTMGTLAHAAALFSQDDTELVVLNRSREAVAAQASIGQLTKTPTTYVDALCNFLPELHAGGVSLFCPSKHWNDFILDAYGEQPDPSFDEDALARLVLQYVKHWGEYNSVPGRYRHIRNVRGSDTVWRVNAMLLDNQLDIASFAAPDNVAKAKKANDLKKLESIFGSFPIISRVWFESVEWTRDAILFEGYLRVQNTCDECELSLALRGSGGTKTLAQLNCSEAEPNKFNWQATIMRKELRGALEQVAGDAGSASLCLRIHTANGDLCQAVGAKRKPGMMALLRQKPIMQHMITKIFFDEDKQGNFICRKKRRGRV